MCHESFGEVTITRSLLITVGLAFFSGCARPARVATQIDALRLRVDDVEQLHIARACAPRHLAVGLARLEHAAFELDRGHSRLAEAHLSAAELSLETAFRIGQACAQVAADDHDGVDGASDQCPEAAEDIDGFEDEDGCPEVQDTDGDGIEDSRDLCVSTPEDLDGYLDEDGCPEPDNDFDGVQDDVDECALTPAATGCETDARVRDHVDVPESNDGDVGAPLI